MEKSVVVLGREKKLCLAELESLFDKKVIIFNQDLSIIDLSPNQINLDKIGGSIKLAKLINNQIISGDLLSQINDLIIQYLTDYLKKINKRKINLGLSFYDVAINLKDIKKIQINLKNWSKNKNFNIRFVPNDNLALSSAKVYYNKLTKNFNQEIIIGCNNQEIILAISTNVQNFNAYTNRDRNRPKRDPKIGMLPPKLAQILINLSTGNHQKLNHSTILDPFCGTGVLLQEAIIMGYDIVGTDINSKMIEYSKANLKWIVDQLNIKDVKINLKVADATNYIWLDNFNYIASETYLGLPFSKSIDQKTFNSNKKKCNSIIKKFLVNLNGQIDQKTRICLALPCWFRQNSVISLDVIDDLNSIGYNLVKFRTVNNRLIYRRPDQIVGREIIVILKK